MPKRKAGTFVTSTDAPLTDLPVPLPPSKRRASQRRRFDPYESVTNPDKNYEVLDARNATRASPGATSQDEEFREDKVQPARAQQLPEEKDDDSLPSLTKSVDSESDLSEIPDDPEEAPNKKTKEPRKASKPSSTKAIAAGSLKSKPATVQEDFLHSEGEDDMDADEEELQEAYSRSPPVNSSVLPLPWEGRLGYACLNTYLRYSNPPVFASRTCRIASILENRHPLKNPNELPHPTKNRPDREQPASIERGQRYVESLGLANARDCIKMIKWNDRYGIKFMRLSSEMFPFASHPEYGYKLAPFASDVLAEVGKAAAELGHRLTTHPGQFTQLGSPRNVVTENAVRDLEYHAEMLSLLRLPPQQDRDAVMILHLGGMFGDKEATLDRFRKVYTALPESIKKRLVLENDDMGWSVHDLLPLCEELNIPMVLDFHHHNIVFDSEKIREGTKDIIELYPRILKTWERKNITPKMHYSEPTPPAVTPKQRRKHSPRVATLPPCPRNMDLMIEAKDKEQAVFELMRAFKLPGFETFNDIIPHVRDDDNKPAKPKRTKKSKASEEGDELPETTQVVPEEDVGMGGPEGRVYWPPGMEEWLRPKKRVVTKKNQEAGPPPSTKKPKKKVPTSEESVKIEEETETRERDISVSEIKAETLSQKPKKARAATHAGVIRKGPRTKKAPGKHKAASDEAEDESTYSGNMRARGRRFSRKTVDYSVESE